ncbi:MAG: proteasome assembly chaperone family protein [Thermoplasmata archaeon]|nr:MAG: proteasome assembly chaperone family protein [Thermoplasmata archaeon]KAA0012399.1 MAG: proteasome assembly chaperone family protein [Thermoplasmata archaeon]
MKEATVVYLEKPDLKEPILIEGLPGVGNVGKIAIEHLIDEIKAKKFAEIYSVDFPPQVIVDSDGIVRLVKNELFYWKGEKDLIMLTGDYQGLSSKGQYILAEAILDVAEEFGTKMIYTLGGYGTGVEVEHPKVRGAATDKELVEELKAYGVVFRGEEGGGIIGASGLLLGLGKMRGMRGACLMGETSGYIVDPNSAREVIHILTEILGIKISFSRLDEKAEEVKRITDRIKSIEKTLSEKKDEDLRYIG